jgi:hypothetical protein
MNAIAGCSPEIGIYTAEIPIYTPETASDWSEIATRSPEIAGSRLETALRSREMPAPRTRMRSNLRKTNELRPFPPV